MIVAACTECDFAEAYPSTRAAHKVGWRNVEADPDPPETDWWTHLGTCPGCVPVHEQASLFG